MSAVKTELHGKSGESFQVILVKGDITKQDVDVIVNSSNCELDLSRGLVSQAILTAAGSSLQDECKTKYPNGIKDGEIAETSGGNMPCQSVYHATLLKTADSSKVEKSLPNIINKCLETAAAASKRSIAFPILGTGKLKYPHDVVAQCVYQSTDRFRANNPGTSLSEVRIVVYPKDVENLKTFEDLTAARAAPAQSAMFGQMKEMYSPESAARTSLQIPVPSHWTPMGKQDYVTSIQLDAEHQEYINVAQQFAQGTDNKFTIVKPQYTEWDVTLL